MTRCALYKHFDADEILLYIGISEIPIDRTRSHGLTSIWMPFIDTMTAKWYGSRLEAITAEREAIANEKPLFNIQYANYDHQPAIDYLERHTFKIRYAKVIGIETAADYLKRTEWPKNVKFPIDIDAEHYNHCYAIIALPCTWCGSENVQFESSLGCDIKDDNRIFGYGVMCSACGKDSWSYVRFIDGHVKVTMQEHLRSFCSGMQPPRTLKKYELKNWSVRLGGSIKESSRARMGKEDRSAQFR